MASSSDKSPSNAGQDDGPGQINWNWTGEDMKMDQTQDPRPKELKASRAYSVATPAMDKARRNPPKAHNPGSIPTAGGVALGGAAREERQRRKSRMSGDMGTPPVDKEGAPDALTEENTHSNVVPPTMNQNGEGSSKVETVDKVEERSSSAPPPPNISVESAEESKGDTVAPLAATTESKEDTVTPVPATTESKEDTVSPLPAAKENQSPPPASKERRGSRLDDVLGKLGLGGKKK